MLVRTGWASLQVLGKRRGKEATRKQAKGREGEGKGGMGRKGQELAAYCDFLIRAQKSVAKSYQNSARQSLKRSIVFTCTSAMPRVCFASESDVLFGQPSLLPA